MNLAFASIEKLFQSRDLFALESFVESDTDIDTLNFLQSTFADRLIQAAQTS